MISCFGDQWFATHSKVSQANSSEIGYAAKPSTKSKTRSSAAFASFSLFHSKTIWWSNGSLETLGCLTFEHF